MFRLLLTSLGLSAATATLVACDPTLTAFTVKAQGFSPSPPVQGKDATLWIDFAVPDGSAVAGGSAKYSISFNGIPFSPTTEDLCTQVTCPIQSQNLSSTSQWPSGLSGKIVSKIQWYDEAGSYLLCSQLTEKS